LILLTKYHLGAEIMKEMAYRRGKVHTMYGWGNLKGKRQLGRPRSRWEDNIRMVFKRSFGTT